MNAKFDFIETDTYVTLQTPKQSIENFYLFKVKGKHVATEYVKDSQGHVIAKGDPYLVGIMYEKTMEKKNSMCYQPSKRFNDIVVHPNEVYATNVDFDGKTLSKCEYLSLCAELY